MLSTPATVPLAGAAGLRSPSSAPVIGTSQGAGVAQLYLVSSRGQVPQTRYVSGTNPADATNCVAETRKYFPPLAAPQKTLRPFWTGFFSALSSGENPGVETSVGNDRKVTARLNFGGTLYPVTFSAQASGTIPDGAPIYMADPLPAPAIYANGQWPAGMSMFIQDRQEVQPGQYICRHGSGAGIPGERQVIGAAGMASQLDVAGAWSGGIVDQAFYGPAGILGDPVGLPDVVLAVTGDSINAQGQDTRAAWFTDGSPANGGGGPFMRAAYNVNGRMIAVLNMAAHGTTAAQFASSNDKRMALMKACGVSHVADNDGTNDTGLSGAQIWALKQTYYPKMRSAGGVQHITALPIVVRTTDPSGNNYSALGDQVVTSGYEVGGTRRDPHNILLRAAIGTLVDGVFDTDKMFRDPTQPDKWRVTGVANGWVADGTHPSVFAVVAQAEAFNGVMAGWSRTGQAAPVVAYDATATAFFARMATAPTAGLKKALSDLFANAAAAGLPLTAAGPFDGLYLPLHNEADSMLNLVSASYPLTKAGTTTFTPFRSFKGDGSTGVYSTGFNPTTAVSPKFVQDSATIGVVSLTDVQEAGEDFGNVAARIGNRNASGQLSVRLHYSAGYVAAVPDGSGIVQLSRTGSAGYDIYKRRPLLLTRAAVSIAPSNNSLQICCPGGATSFSTKELGGAWMGRGLTQAEAPLWYDLVATFQAKTARLAA
ncbi:hypothetical protein [Sphingomonas sp.]|uniref:hypothetical protein n=1 Tax=Sphingomonas sp. TaxID=28214 RepID=UPI003AFFE784